MAGVAYGGRQAGHVTADGHSMQRWAARGGGAAYVMQDEVLPTWDTPREALTTAALLRLPAGMPREKKLRRVEALLETLVRLPAPSAREGARGKVQGCSALWHAICPHPLSACTAPQELTACADVVIGDATRGVRGLSGGQRRRVTGEGRRRGRRVRAHVAEVGECMCFRAAAPIGSHAECFRTALCSRRPAPSCPPQWALS